MQVDHEHDVMFVVNLHCGERSKNLLCVMPPVFPLTITKATRGRLKSAVAHRSFQRAGSDQRLR